MGLVLPVSESLAGLVSQSMNQQTHEPWSQHTRSIIWVYRLLNILGVTRSLPAGARRISASRAVSPGNKVDFTTTGGKVGRISSM